MECSQTLRAEAKPYLPLATCGGPPPVAKLPSPGVFTLPVPYPYPAPPPQTGFLGALPGCWGIPLGPGGVGMQGIPLPHPVWAPPMPPPDGARATPAGTPCTMAKAASQGGGKLPSRSVRTGHVPGVAKATSQGGGKLPSRSVRTGRAPGARPPPPRLDVPPRLQRSAAARPGAPTASHGAKTAAAGGHGPAKEDPASCGAKAPVAGEEAAANEPSPRSVLVATSPPISPTPSLPSSLPLPCLPPATAALAPPTEPPPCEHGTASKPAGQPMRRRRGPPRAQPAPRVDVRRGVRKPRLLFDPDSNRTTLMIRHLPNDFTRKRVMAIIDEHCFMENERIAPVEVKSEYDFLYVPIDFRTMANKGYAFVNMTSPDAARRLWEHLHGYRWRVRRCGKTCAVDYGAVQGLDRLVDHFSLSSFECDSEELLPVRFEPPRDGTRPALAVAHVVGGLRRRS